jgi:maleylpyruvate isomerase
MTATDFAPVQISHARLRETLHGLTDVGARRPSLLPGWTVGHVLTHLARNADSHVRMLEGARRGDVADQYPGGNEQRAADIEAGAGRPAAELVADVVGTARRLEKAWADTPDEVRRTGQGRVVSGLWPLAELPLRRWREVEIHHVDLGLAYGIEDWPDAYVDAELALALPALDARLPAGATVDVGALDRRRLLAWIVGRSRDPSLPVLTPWAG